MGPGENENKELIYHKVAGAQNPSNLFTKFLASDAVDAHLNRLGYEHASGKDDIGLSIHALEFGTGLPFVRGFRCTPAPRGSARFSTQYLSFSHLS